MNPIRRIVISIDDQRLHLMEDTSPVRSYVISTAAKGMGFTEGSFRTPTGNFRISGKIGDGEASGTIFKARVPVGLWQPGTDDGDDLILSRILRLDGLDEENANTQDRYIYIHGTNQEQLLGTPASHGCVRMANADMIELHDLVSVGTEVVIEAATRRRGKLLFIDCDSTLSTIEGIDELAHAGGEELFARVVALTHAAMNGEVPLDEVFPRRMELIRPDRASCESVAGLYKKTIVSGVPELIRAVKAEGWLPVILSGGFAPLIRPLAEELGIAHVEAVPLFLNEDGSYKGYEKDYPTTRNLGKNEVIREWKVAMLPERVVMIGDGISDMETMPDVDRFIGFGGVVARAKVKGGCDHWLTSMTPLCEVMEIINGGS
jgi:HAD superfamily phosphoserine phosphatase-like hydrolase